MQKTQARFVKMRAKTSAFVTSRGPSLYRGKNILNARAKWRVYATIWRTYAPNVKSNESQNSFYPKYRLKGFNLTFGPYFNINLERFRYNPVNLLCMQQFHAIFSSNSYECLHLHNLFAKSCKDRRELKHECILNVWGFREDILPHKLPPV